MWPEHAVGCLRIRSLAWPWVSRVGGCGVVGGWVFVWCHVSAFGWVGGVHPYVENFTVDASIFVVC